MTQPTQDPKCLCLKHPNGSIEVTHCLAHKDGTTHTTPTQPLDEQIDKIIEMWDFSPFQDEDSRIERVHKEIKALISDQVAKAVDKTLTDLEDFKQEVLESRGIPNPTYVGKKELQEWIDNRRATLNGVKNK